MGVRFRVEPGDVPEYAAARRLGLTEAEFAQVKDRLHGRGFPYPDPDTGLYDLDAIDMWRRRRHRHLFRSKDAAIGAGVAVLEARIAKLKSNLEPTAQALTDPSLIRKRIEAQSLEWSKSKRTKKPR